MFFQKKDRLRLTVNYFIFTSLVLKSDLSKPKSFVSEEARLKLSESFYFQKSARKLPILCISKTSFKKEY